MLKSTLTGLMLSLLLLVGSGSENSAAREKQKSPDIQTETVEKLVVANGSVSIELDLNQLNSASTSTEKSKLETLLFALAPDSYFTIVVTNDVLRGPLPGSMALIPQNAANLPALLSASFQQLVLEKNPSGEAYEFVVRDRKSGFVFFNVEGHHYNYDASTRSFSIHDGALLISGEFSRQLDRPSGGPALVGKLSVSASMSPIEIQTVVNGEVQAAILPSVRSQAQAEAQTEPDAVTAVPGPDVIVGDLPAVTQPSGTSGINGSFVGLGVGTTSCNNGDQEFNWFALPNTDHPVIPQNLYRMSGGTGNNDRFEQIGQSQMKHGFTALQENACGFGCSPAANGTHLGVGCSDPYSSSLNYEQARLGSRAWVNPFTGAYPSTSNSHTGHSHTGTSHRLTVAMSDLTAATNPGATYYAEGQYITPHEYAWCQSHPGQCNQYNNVSYRRFNVAGTTNFTFTSVGSTVRMQPAIKAWTGATINQFEPAPGVDGIGFVGYKVTNPSAGVWHYEYAVYNQTIDRAIQSFSVPLGPGVTVSNIGFRAPAQEPAWANDGTVGNAGYSSTAWTPTQTAGSLTWNSETFAANQNANALRWGTVYNFRFDADQPPLATNATVGFFKTGSPITVGIQGPFPAGPTPTPDPNATPTPTPTPSPTPTPTPTPTPVPTPSPTPGPCGGPVFNENFDGVTAPALPAGWVATNMVGTTFWVTSTAGTPAPAFDSSPNAAFIIDPTAVSERRLDTLSITVTSGSPQISFRNNYHLEASGGQFYDGGVLEVSSPNINGGAFTDITNAAVGGSFSSGGYNAVLAAGSALAGRNAWSGNSGGYVTTVANLGPNVVGQSIKLRFRLATDNGNGSPVSGWRIDTITSVGLCVPPTATPTPTPTPVPIPTPCQTFPNTTTITIVDSATAPTMASLYPSTVTVAGLSGTVTHVQVKLNGISHTFPDDIDILLVGPGGQNAILMSDVGGGNPGPAGVTLTLDDFAASSLPDGAPLVTGVFKPTNVNPGTGTETWPAPAPAPAGGSVLSVFNGTAPNGTWSLYLVDDESQDAGTMAGGWELSITTTNCLTATPTPVPPTPTPALPTPTPTATPGCGVIVSLPPQKDNTLYEDANGQLSNGLGIYLFAGLTDLNGGVGMRRGLIAFDFSSIPANAIITAATLSMNLNRSGPDPDPVNVSLSKMLSNWGEGASDAGSPGGAGIQAEPGDATWLHTFYSNSFWTTPGGDFSGTSSATTAVSVNGTTYAWSSAQLVADVQSWVSGPASNFGWVIRADEVTPGSAVRFGSRENSTNPPQLSVTYYVSCATPTPTPPLTANVTGTVIYCTNPALPPVPNVTMSLTGAPPAPSSTLTDGSGTYTLSGLSTGASYTVTPTKASLPAGTSGINTSDSIAIQRHFLNLGTPLSGCRLLAADTNDPPNGVSTSDAIAAQRFFLGLTTGIAQTGRYKFTPASTSYTPITGNMTGQNYSTVILGDAATAFTAPRPAGGSSQDAAIENEVAPTVTAVALPDLTLAPSQTHFTAAVTTSAIDAKNNLIGFQGDFTFDERVITFENQPVSNAGLTAGNWNVSGNVLAGPGPIRTLRISAFSLDSASLSGTGTLFNLNMIRVDKTGQGTPLVWAPAADQFIFIDADLNTQKAGNAAPGNVNTSRKRN